MDAPAGSPLIRVLASGAHRFEVRCHGRPGVQPVLLWLPALGVGARHYDALGAALATEGVALAVPDPRGIGSSTLRAARHVQWDYQDVLGDAATVLDALAAEHGGRAWLGGHSIGGQFATLLAAHRRGSVHGLALVATGMPHWRHYRARAAGLLLFAGWVRLASALAGYYPGRRLGFAGDESARLMREWTRTILGGRYRLRGHDQGALLAQVDVPILTVGMQHDWMIPRSSTEALVAMTGSRDLQAVQLADADFIRVRSDHFGWLREPRPVARCIARFVAARAGQGHPRG